MSKKVYNKLVRSEIPEIIKSEGRECLIAKLNLNDNKDEIIHLLKEKLVEEANEVLSAKNNSELLEEVGDLQTVLAELRQVALNWRDIETVMEAKNIQKGRFSQIVDANGKPVSRGHAGESQYIKLISVEDNEG